MRKITVVLGVGLLMVAVAVFSCKKDQSVDDEDSVAFDIPEGWPHPVYNFEDNALTQAGFVLGRKLFFETKLSLDNTISCGSCHQPFYAFSQLDHDISHGVGDSLGIRNSPALFNLNWHSGFFWDGGVNHIEVQPFNPIQNPVEMAETLQNVLDKLQADTAYPAMFKAAFGTEEITTQRLGKALAQFMGVLVSANSKYDKYVRNEAGGEFTDAEEAGLQVYRDKCAACHAEPLFSDFSYRNNGLELVNNSDGYIDSGRGRITPDDLSNYYRFKVPSLRNLKYTAPFMHDGRFATIDLVLEHYTNGIHQTPNLDTLLTNGITLTDTEKSNLKEFLNTLNDETFVNDERFKQP
ncbi:MAG: cytochrome-c peroxidase [Edaphocola sp.]